MAKKLSLGKKILIIVLILVLLLGGGVLAYRLMRAQGVVEDQGINSDIESPKLVIATQQSNYKDQVIAQVIEDLENEEINILITDVTRLEELNDSDWDALVILTTVESSQIQENSYNFLENHKNDFDKIGVVYTADSNDWNDNDLGIDAIASSSSNSNVEECAQAIIDKSNDILENLQ